MLTNETETVMRVAWVSYAAEFLVRAGIGKLTIMDGDDFDRTNRNRQLGALRSTEGKMKVGLSLQLCLSGFTGETMLVALGTTGGRMCA
eukprot:1646713-Rhodomonas_salina.3